MIKLNGITVESFAHPEEKKALEALQKVKIVEKALNWIANEETRIVLKTEIMGNYVGIMPKDTPKLYGLVEEVCDILDFHPVPQLYTHRSVDFDIKIFAAKHPMLVIPDFILNDFDEEMLRFEIGCAITALKAKTDQLKMLASATDMITDTIPVIGEALVPVLANWSRKASYTEDRGGLLACQSYEAAMRTLIRITGLPVEYINADYINEYVKQYKPTMNLAGMSQYAQTVVRMKAWNNDRIVELYKWYHSGAYDDILEDYE